MQRHTQKNGGGWILWVSIDFGCIFKQFRLLQQERIHLWEVESEPIPCKYAHVVSKQRMSVVRIQGYQFLFNRPRYP